MSIVCGVDEAGRGPLAGPVVSGAVILDPNNPIEGLADSKKLSKKKREALCDLILERALSVGVGIASAKEIDEINILQASLLSMRRAVSNLSIEPTLALVDGNQDPQLPCETITIIKGDAKEAAISAASIVAKVHRDRLMARLDQLYPKYLFAQHAGYPTKLHMTLLAEHGPCPEHRQSFAPVKRALLIPTS